MRIGPRFFKFWEFPVFLERGPHYRQGALPLIAALLGAPLPRWLAIMQVNSELVLFGFSFVLDVIPAVANESPRHAEPNHRCAEVVTVCAA
jgi:hypothetical protein